MCILPSLSSCSAAAAFLISSLGVHPVPAPARIIIIRYVTPCVMAGKIVISFLLKKNTFSARARARGEEHHRVCIRVIFLLLLVVAAV